MFDFEYIGNLHIHSLYSDGGGNVSEIAQSAVRAGLDFICINDHDFMTDSLHLDEEGFYDSVLVLMGLEIGERYHHYLAYDVKDMIKGNGLGPQEVIDQVNKQGGFGFLAHPFEKGMPFIQKSVAYTWNDLTVNQYTGICIWNFTSRWKERIKTIFHGLYCLTFKRQSLKGPSKKTLFFWDQLCRQRRAAAIGGSDAHGSTFKWGFNFRPLLYDYLLSTINTHVLLNRKMSRELPMAKKEIYGALKEGRSFIAHDRLYPACGFRFYYLSDDGSDLFMGEEDDFHPGEFVVELPDHGEIRLLKDGNIEKRWRGIEAIHRIKDKGVYRIEVYRHLFLFGWRPWIFSNPIYLR
ncbi:MAG: CehA/McbA family metallohydrolase [Thermodesulfobacteriota bacterium]|nr:CehA/McbA family metallohydrolase [Thermodesulfobacteriota bacterium]